MAKVCWIFSTLGWMVGSKWTICQLWQLIMAQSEQKKQTNKSSQWLGMGPIKTIELKTYPNFGPLGSIWIKIMNLSDEDITKCLSGRGHCFKSQIGQRLTGETSYQYCYLDLVIWYWLTICQLNQFNTKSEAAILSKQEQSGKEYICNSHWRLARLENKTSSAASSNSGLTLLELFIIVGDIRTLHLASWTGLVWVSGWESRRVASSERQKNVQSKTLLSTQSSSNNKTNTIYCVCFRETVAG